MKKKLAAGVLIGALIMSYSFIQTGSTGSAVGAQTSVCYIFDNIIASS